MLVNHGVGEDFWESLDCKEIQPVHPKGNQSWIFIGRTDAEDETPILWPPYVKNWLIRTDPDAGKIERGRRRGRQMMRWLDGITGSMDMSLINLWELALDRACCSPWGRQKSDTEQLNCFQKVIAIARLSHHETWANLKNLPKIYSHGPRVLLTQSVPSVQDTTLCRNHSTANSFLILGCPKNRPWGSEAMAICSLVAGLTVQGSDYTSFSGTMLSP